MLSSSPKSINASEIAIAWIISSLNASYRARRWPCFESNKGQLSKLSDSSFPLSIQVRRYTYPYHPPSQPPLSLRLRLDQIPQPFNLCQIHPPRQKRLPRELASLGGTTAGHEGEGGEDFGEDREGGVGVKFEERKSCEGVGSCEKRKAKQEGRGHG